MLKRLKIGTKFTLTLVFFSVIPLILITKFETGELRSQLWLILGILMIAILITSLIVNKVFTAPIIKLRNAVLKVAHGDFNVDLKMPFDDELGELSDAFREMTEKLADTRDDLREVVKELAANLKKSKGQEEKLAQQKKDLEKVNLELDSFVYTASHDLRAPLRGIASFAEFLEEDYKDKLDEEGKDYLSEIHKGANRLSALIDDLLALSRISRIKNPYENVPINDLILSIIKRIEFDIQEKKVNLIIQEKIPTIVCDRVKVGEVFLNLINNAIKFSSKERPTPPKIEIGYRDRGPYHEFFVKDNGIGIEEQYHEKIFGIFKRLHKATEYEGTGAGLSIVKRVIDDHDGQIWIESKVSRGSTFFFTIPKGLQIGESDEDEEEDRLNINTQKKLAEHEKKGNSPS